VNVSWIPPATPTFTSAIAFDYNSVGLLHTVKMVVSHPTPSGGQPAVVTSDVYARPVGDSSAGLRVGIDVPKTVSSQTYHWFGPAANSWQVMIIDKAADGTTAASAWQTVTGTNTTAGAMLHDPAAPTTTLSVFKFNDEGVSERRDVDSALVPVAGREFPLAEYGPQGTRSYTIGKLHSKGLSGLFTDANKIKALLERRSVLCYRDKRGRTMYGRLTLGDLTDTFYGQEFSLQLDQVYAYLTPPNDVA
jgi:hypothetical protein